MKCFVDISIRGKNIPGSFSLHRQLMFLKPEINNMHPVTDDGTCKEAEANI